MVRSRGLEPLLIKNWILNPARLPIPPRPHRPRGYGYPRGSTVNATVFFKYSINRNAAQPPFSIFRHAPAYPGTPDASRSGAPAQASALPRMPPDPIARQLPPRSRRQTHPPWAVSIMGAPGFFPFQTTGGGECSFPASGLSYSPTAKQRFPKLQRLVCEHDTDIAVIAGHR